MDIEISISNFGIGNRKSDISLRRVSPGINDTEHAAGD